MTFDRHGIPLASPARPLVDLLHQLAAVIDRLDDLQYRAETARGVSGSIGAHVRHTLDHVAAFLEGADDGELSYDSRMRGTAVETARDAALGEIRRLCGRLHRIRPDLLDAPVHLVTLLEHSGPSLVGRSSVGRELAFVVAHTVHHCAIIALLLRDLGVTTPPRFGYAPSTPAPELTPH